MHIIYFILVCCFINSAIAQEKIDFDNEKIVNLPIGSTFVFDGKAMSKFHSTCPVKSSEEFIDGKKIITTKRDYMTFKNGNMKCGEHTIFQRIFSIRSVPAITPLKCKVDTVKADNIGILIGFESPCDFLIHGHTSILPFTDAPSEMTIGSLMYNLGKHVQLTSLGSDKMALEVNDDSREQIKNISGDKPSFDTKASAVPQ